MILSQCGGYTLESLLKVSIKQFIMLTAESTKLQARQTMITASLVRISVGGSPEDYKRWYEVHSSVAYPRPAKQKAVAPSSAGELKSMGLEVT